MRKSNIQWIAVDVGSRDYFRSAGEHRELEAIVRGSIPLNVDTINLVTEHQNLNRLLSGHGPMQIKKVIFNPPATIVLWEDGDKTIVKIQNNETYDPEKGLAMAIAKRALGNEGNYFNHIKKWVDQYREEQAIMPSKKKTPIKDLGKDGFCYQCRWRVNGAECNPDIACGTCPHFDEEKGQCKCLNISIDDPCPYFEEVPSDDYKMETHIESATVEKKEPKHPIYIKHGVDHGTILVEFGSRKDAEDCLEALNELCNVYGSCDVGDLYNLCAIHIIGDDPLGGENYTHGWTSMKGVEVCELLDSLDTVYTMVLPKPLPLK